MWTRISWGSMAFLMMALLAVSGEVVAIQELSERFTEQRHRMVTDQIHRRGLGDPQVLEVMGTVPRHLFVPGDHRGHAYEDQPLPIGHGQTISQPYMVALMTSLLKLGPEDRVLEIGTGSGYQSAVLARLAREVYTIEIIEELGQRAERTLHQLGYGNVRVRIGDGYRGWPEAAPFDAILLTAAPPEVPQPLLDQLSVGGVLVAPVGDDWQQLQVITRTPDGFEKRLGEPVRFVPMIGEAQTRRGEH